MDHLYIMENIGCDLKEKCDRRVVTEQVNREIPAPVNRLPSDMNRNACSHINSFKADEGLKIYNTVHSHFIACTTALYRKRKIVNTVCLQCRSRKRLHSCLHCVFFGCYDGHVQAHYNLHDHFLYVDLTYGNILCMKCGDYEYDDELADIARKNIVDASRSLGHPVPSWIPLWLSRNEITEVQRHSKRLRISTQTPVGLRPLINLGNTCYMNCIIQVLMHTPLLRNYLMSERHKCSNSDGMCVMCEISQLFQEFYGGGRGLLAPDRFLYLMWSHAPQLSGHKQQDAQEFFMATLDMLHKNCVHSTLSSSNSQNTENTYSLDERTDSNLHNGEDSLTKCQSIIEHIFMGKYQSDVVCQNCKEVSSRIDPFWDIQLDLGPTPDGSSLLDCLKRFTSPEKLGAENKIMCNNCNSIQERTMQLTVKKIPIVASFQLKRFKRDPTKSHIPNVQLNKKVSTFISFPEMLDMSPFMTKPRNDISETHVFTPFDNRYILFGVINHQGELNAGHYTAFVRLQPNFWYKCDDNKITRAPVKEVLASEGYLLFYHKRTLEYF